MRKIFTILFALVASVGMMNAKVTWNSSNVSDLSVFGTYESYSKEGVTLSANAEEDVYARWYGYEDESHSGIGFHALQSGGFTFTNTLGKNFTKIEMFLRGPGDWDIASDEEKLGSGWSFFWNPGEDESLIVVSWKGNAKTVDLLKEASDFHGALVKSIVFYFVGDSEEPDPTYTIALQDGTVNADKVTLSKTSAVEGATITVTPNEEYEIKDFKATYNTTEEAASTLDPATGAYSFKMPAYDVTIKATIALKPVPEGDIFAGFTATAGSGGFDNEGSANLVDNKFTSDDWTKWCTNNDHRSVPTGESGDACWWLDFEASAALNLTGYILTTGNDTGNEHGRNPKNWVLKAKLNADDAWTTIATVTDDVTMKNQSFKDYKFFVNVDQSGSYKYFRFEVFANQGANVMQLCELRLIGTEASEPVLVTANTLQLHVNDAAMGSVAVTNLLGSDIIDNGDGTFTVPEGAEVTLLATPNDGYEFTGWKASRTICDFAECEFVALNTVDNPLTFDMYAEAAFMAEFAAVAPQPQIGPKEVLDLGTTGCVGEHYQLTGGGTNIYRTVGGVDNKTITIESLHGEIIDNISLKLYYYNVWTGYSVAASSGDVSSWNYDAYEDLVITNINATSVTLSRVGSGQENGYVMFEKVTINNSDEPTPTYTVALEDGTANADKVALSATSAVEGATVTVTPNEEYEITDFTAYYVVVNGQVGTINEIDATLDPATGAYSFTMPAYDVTIEATIALKPAPATPTVYNSGSVALSNLKVGDILMAGVTLTDDSNSKVKFVPSRLKLMGNIRKSELTVANFVSSLQTPLLGENAAMTFQGGAITITPIDEEGKDGNAWEVTEIFVEADIPVTLAGITYSGTEPDPATPTVWTALKVGDVIKVGDQLSPSVEWESANDYGVIKPDWAPYTLLRANIAQENEWDDPVVTEAEDGAYYVLKFTHPSAGTYYLLANSAKGTLLAATATSDGLEVTNVGDDYGTPAFTFAVHENGSAPTAVENVQTNEVQASKLMENGVLYILHNGVKYNVQGARVR